MNRTIGRVLLIAAAVMLAVVPIAAIGAGSFEDVPEDNVFKADIDWLASVGVTKGCNPPQNTKYCPDNNVTRGQMAAFMHRLAVNRVIDADSVDGKDASAFAAASHDHGSTYLARTGKAADSDKLDGSRLEAIAPRAAGTEYFRDSMQPDRFEASVVIDAPAPGIIIAGAGGDSWAGTAYQICGLFLDGMAGSLINNGYVDHAQDDEADCSVTGSIPVDAGMHTVDLHLGGDGIQQGKLWAMWVPFDGLGAAPVADAVLDSSRDGRTYGK